MLQDDKKILSTYVDKIFYDKICSTLDEQNTNISNYLRKLIINDLKVSGVDSKGSLQSSKKDIGNRRENMDISEGDRKLIVTEVGKEISGYVNNLSSKVNDLSKNLDSLSGRLDNVNSSLEQVNSVQESLKKAGDSSCLTISQVKEMVESVGKGVQDLITEQFSVSCPECGKCFQWHDGLEHCPHCGVPVEIDND